MSTEPQTAQAAPLAADPRNLSASPATAAPPMPDGAGTRRPGADNSPTLEKLAPDLAAEIDPTPADVGPMIELPDVETRIAGGLDGLDRGLTLLAVDPTTKAPIGRAQSFLDGRRNLTPAEVERHARDGAFFAVCPEPSNLVIGDLDDTDPAAAGPWAEHFTGAHVAPTRRGGRHAFYRRPDGTPARRVIRAEGRPVDVLGKGYVILWSGYAPEPVELPPDLAAVLDPPKPREPGMTGGPVIPAGDDRGGAYAAAAISGTVGTLLALPDGQRQDGLNLHTFDLGRALKRASAGHLAGQVVDVIAAAVPWADTRKERSTIRRALAAGIAAEREGLRDRAPVTLTTAAAERLPELEPIASAMLDQLAGLVRGLVDDDGRIHPMSRFTVELLAAELLRRHIETGRASIVAGSPALGLAIGRGADAITRGWRWLRALGWIIEPGAVDDDGAARGTVYTLNLTAVCGNGQVAERRKPRVGGGAVGLAEGRARTLRELSVSTDPFTVGMRRRYAGKLGDAFLHVWAAGPGIHKTVSALIDAAEDGMTIEDQAVVTGQAERTIRRHLERLRERGVLVERSNGRLGRAGRPVLIFALRIAGAIATLTRRMGERWAERVKAGMVAFRDLCNTARRMVELGKFQTWKQAFTFLSRNARARAAAEREAVSPGGERGRPGWDREDAGRALANAAAWARHNAETAGVKS